MKNKFQKEDIKFRYLEAGKDIWKIKDQFLYHKKWRSIPVSFIGKLVSPNWHSLGRRKNDKT